MNQLIVSPKWWQYLARFLLGLTVVVVCVCVYSMLGAKNIIGEKNFGFALGYALLFSFSYVTLLGMTLLAMVGVVVGFLLEYSLKLYVIMFVLSLVVIFYFENTL